MVCPHMAAAKRVRDPASTCCAVPAHGRCVGLAFGRSGRAAIGPVYPGGSDRRYTQRFGGETGSRGQCWVKADAAGDSLAKRYEEIQLEVVAQGLGPA